MEHPHRGTSSTIHSPRTRISSHLRCSLPTPRRGYRVEWSGSNASFSPGHERSHQGRTSSVEVPSIEELRPATRVGMHLQERRSERKFVKFPARDFFSTFTVLRTSPSWQCEWMGPLACTSPTGFRFADPSSLANCPALLTLRPISG
jgi:hypothetical protein